MVDLARRLNEAGLKATGPRVALLEALETDRTHPTVEDLHERVRREHPSVSLSTVYLGVEAFLAVGLCRRVQTRDGKMRLDGVEALHDHAVCVRCGEIFDVSAELYPRPSAVPALPNGLAVRAVRVEYEVLCTGCTDRADLTERAN